MEPQKINSLFISHWKTYFYIPPPRSPHTYVDAFITLAREVLAYHKTVCGMLAQSFILYNDQETVAAVSDLRKDSVDILCILYQFLEADDFHLTERDRKRTEKVIKQLEDASAVCSGVLARISSNEKWLYSYVIGERQYSRRKDEIPYHVNTSVILQGLNLKAEYVTN